MAVGPMNRLDERSCTVVGLLVLQLFNTVTTVQCIQYIQYSTYNVIISKELRTRSIVLYNNCAD